MGTLILFNNICFKNIQGYYFVYGYILSANYHPNLRMPGKTWFELRKNDLQANMGNYFQ